MAPEQTREKLAELSALVGGLAHEIKNPLSTMKITLQLLQEAWSEEPGAHAHTSLQKIDMLLGETERLEQMLQEFMRLATPTAPDLQLEDLNGIIEELLEFTASEFRNANVVVMRQFDSSLPSLQLDRHLFRQALLNLLKNALQALDERGGTVTIQTRATPDEAVLEVIDSGKGMSPGTLAEAFSFYFSTKPEGTGLGLPMVKRIVEQHGGTITCESEVGRGTKFTIRLPKVGAAARE